MAKQEKNVDRGSKFLIAFLVLFAILVLLGTLYFTRGSAGTSNTVFLTNTIETTLTDDIGETHPLDVTLYFEVNSSEASDYDTDEMQVELMDSLSNISYTEFADSDDPVGIIKETAVDTMLELYPNAAEDISDVYVSDIQTGQRQIANGYASRQDTVMRGLFKKIN